MTERFSAWRRPDFLIVGAQKAGTTSLFRYLSSHPRVHPPAAKELHFFDERYDRGAGWYFGHFPPAGLFPGVVTGEASPWYLFHPAVPARVRELLPEVRLIALLRDPVHRAYSQYQHNLRRGRLRGVSFEAALAEEERLVEEELDPARLRPLSFVSRGFYAEQLERWFAHFAREQLLVLPSERFFADPGGVLDRVFAFLGLPPHPVDTRTAHNRHPYEPLPAEARERLTALFRSANERLFALLGERFPWEGCRP